MTRRHDESNDMTDVLRFPGPADGSVPPDDDLTRLLTEVRALGDGPAPEPSPEVAALLAGARPVRRRRSGARIVARLAAAAALVVGVLVSGAASHRLPSPVQQMVSRVVNDLTPFRITPPRTPASPVPTAPPVRHTSPAPAPTEADDGSTGGEQGGTGTGDETRDTAPGDGHRSSPGDDPSRRSSVSERGGSDSGSGEGDAGYGGQDVQSPSRTGAAHEQPDTPLPSAPDSSEPGTHDG